MFDLTKAIAGWKRSLRKYESFEDGTIAELESHLLDEFDRLTQSGLSEEAAFAEAAATIGQPEAVGGEYFQESHRSRFAVPDWLRPCCSPGLLLQNGRLALRRIRRQKGYSLINITGLATGLACSLLMLLWVRDELSFDRFHEYGPDIYRVVAIGRDGRGDASSPAPLAPAMKAEIPEVVDAVRVQYNPRLIFKHNQYSFYENRGITADASLFKIFSFPLKRGDPGTLFTAPLNIVISESLARKYFPGVDPMGKSILVEGQASLTVTGVMADIPPNSHLRFDYVVPVALAESFRIWGMEWGDFNFKTYFRAAPRKSGPDLARKLDALSRKHQCPQVVEGLVTLGIQPLAEIYLHPVPGGYDIGLGNQTRVYLFTIVAILILLLASVNFINLTTARAEKRAKEVGLRKVAGATRTQLAFQFFAETVLTTFLALVSGFFLARAAIPWFNELTGKELVIDLLDPGLILLLAALAVLAGLAAGVIPSLYLTSFQPAPVLKGAGGSGSFSPGRTSGRINRGTLRRLLVIGQFSITIMLLTGTAIVFQQLRFLREQSWSSGRDRVLYLPIKENLAQKYGSVRSEILQDPGVTGVAAKDSLPTFLNNHTSGVGWEGKRPDQNNIFMETSAVDEHYFQTMQMPMAAGRGFSIEFPGDRGGAFVLNEEAIRRTGMTDPVGKAFRLYGQRGKIIGVVKNTVFQSLRQELRPQVFYLFNDLPAEASGGVILVRIRGDQSAAQLTGVISRLEQIWNRVNTWAPFEWHFLDEAIAAQYGDDYREGRLTAAFSVLAIFISCLGLTGLASFVAGQRTREIGIRKVLGAPVPGILFLLAREFGKWVLIANLIAWPAAWLITDRWLQNFTRRISPGAGLFLAAGAATLLIAMLTVIFQSWRAARANPVDSLKYE